MSSEPNFNPKTGEGRENLFVAGAVIPELAPLVVTAMAAGYLAEHSSSVAKKAEKSVEKAGDKIADAAKDIGKKIVKSVRW